MTRLAGRLRVALNQASIRRAANTAPRILLAPRPPVGGRGSVDHYFHFVFDLLMPLSRLLAAGPPRATLQLSPMGPLTVAFRDVFGDAIEILAESERDSAGRCETLVGMNPHWVHWTGSDIEDFRRFILRRFSIAEPREPDTVVLIERMPPDPYFLRSSPHRGSGASRRSLTNHAELQDWLARAVRSPYRFLNLQLETMPLCDQVDAFSRAALVVGQHGAGLANVAWMARGQTVVELDNLERDHFFLVCRARRCHFLRHRLGGRHAVVDMPRFRTWVETRPELRRFFA